MRKQCSLTHSAQIAALLFGLQSFLQAQIWTQVPMPNLQQYDTGSSSTQTVPPQPSFPSVSNPQIVKNPGVGNTGGGQYVNGCTYQNGTQGEYGGPPIWWNGAAQGAPWVKSGLTKVTGPSAYLYTSYIGTGSGGYGLQFYGSFQGSTSSGLAS